MAAVSELKESNMTINEGLALQKALKSRHTELTQLRNQNANQRKYRVPGQPEEIETPLYDPKKVDGKLVKIAKELRMLDAAIKAANAKTRIEFVHDESILSAIED